MDIDIIYSLIDQDFERFETANCTYKSKILICDYKGRDIDYLYCIKIMANKINSSISSVTKWNNVSDNKISIYLDVNTGFISSTRIYKNNKGNYIFKLYVNTYVPKYSLCSVDILI